VGPMDERKLENAVLLYPRRIDRGERGDDSTVDPTRGHRRGDEARKETDSPNEDDLLPISELLREACARIEDRKRADAKGRPGADTVTARWRDRGRSFPAPDTRLQWPGRGPTALEVPQYWTGPPGLRVIGPP
jgi:hypothetical protein